MSNSAKSTWSNNMGLAKAYWGQGIATQAVKAAVSYGFNVAHLDKLIAMALPNNLASKRVIEKAGLQYQKPIYMFNLDILYYSMKSMPSFPAWYFDESKMAGIDFEEHSTYGWIIEGMLTRAGFEIVEANYNASTYAEYLCIKAA